MWIEAGIHLEHVAITATCLLISDDNLEPLIKLMWTLCEETKVPRGNPRKHGRTRTRRSGGWCVSTDGLVSHSELLTIQMQTTGQHI